jgi:hypothetical protein
VDESDVAKFLDTALVGLLRLALDDEVVFV